MTVQTHTRPTRRARRSAYEDRLHTLSVASVEQHFDAFKDIAWDDPDFAMIGIVSPSLHAPGFGQSPPFTP